MAIHFEIQRAGRVFSASADGGAAFFVGIQTHFTDRSSGQSFEGLFNVPTRQLPPLLYKADAFRPAQKFWADFIEPTALCEGQTFLTLNTYDRARFTWGFPQFGAHVANGDFVRFFRDMLGLPESSDYFPDLKIVDGRICKVQNGNNVQLESDAGTGPLMDYGRLDELRPSLGPLLAQPGSSVRCRDTSGVRGEADSMCSQRTFRVVTQSGNPCGRENFEARGWQRPSAGLARC
jgi:hypothetical protein